MNIFEKLLEQFSNERIEECKKLIISKKINKKEVESIMSDVIKEMNLSSDNAKFLVNRFNEIFGDVFNEADKNNENVSDNNKIIELEKIVYKLEKRLTFMSNLLNSFINAKLNEDTQK